jgi:carbonic anhydrase/acetyltransferase-like protein (isoleucine patch superfamily)
VLVPFQGKQPVVGENVYVAPTALVIGDVELGEGSSVWHGAVLRGDVSSIRIGSFSNIQDLCVCHVTTGGPALVVGSRVTVGHRAVLHSCTIEDGCLIGMGSVLLDGATVGRGSIVAAGSVLLQGFSGPPYSLLAGVPAAVKKSLERATAERLAEQADEYHKLALAYLGRQPFRPGDRRI